MYCKQVTVLPSTNYRTGLRPCCECHQHIQDMPIYPHKIAQHVVELAAKAGGAPEALYIPFFEGVGALITHAIDWKLNMAGGLVH